MAFIEEKFNQISSGKNTNSSVSYSYLGDQELSLKDIKAQGYFNQKANALRVNDIIEVVSPQNGEFTYAYLRVSSITNGIVETVDGSPITLINQYLSLKFLADPLVVTDGFFPVTSQIGLNGYKVLGIEYYFTGTVGIGPIDLGLRKNAVAQFNLNVNNPSETRYTQDLTGTFDDLGTNDYISVIKTSGAHAGAFSMNIVWKLEPIFSP